MATACCDLFRLHNIQFVVAPYEADIQLAYMWEQKQIDFVITEDSDLIAHGVGSCFYKYDMGTGDGKWGMSCMCRPGGYEVGVRCIA